MEEREVLNYLDKIMQFLARRDIGELSQEEFDLAIVLGSSFYESVELGAELLSAKRVKTLLLSGGIGHSTYYLEQRLSKDIGVKIRENYAESDYFYDLISKYDTGNIYVERESKNCGENALFSLNLIEKLVSEGKFERPKRVLLIQDPTLQRRTHATFEHVWKNFSCEFFSFAPIDIKFNERETFKRYFSFDRALDLLLGEIVRLQDSKSGYGPKGRGFISHVDIPSEIQEAYDILVERFPKYKEWILRG